MVVGLGNRVDVIVLAGDRGPGDPLAIAAGVAGKALVPVAGRPMLARVLDVLENWGSLDRLVLVAPNAPAYRKCAASAGFDGTHRLVWVEPSESLSGSVSAALEACRTPLRLLLTADHALLDPGWLDRLVAAASESDRAGLFVGLSDWQKVMQRFPGSRRTRYRFSDRSICGTNLFAVHGAEIGRLLEVWQEVERERKRPWRIVGLLGWRNLAMYLAGRLALEPAFASLSQRLGLEVHPVLIHDPLAAVDVDSPADLVLVETVLKRRAFGTC